jgi:saccharopine dehydrogenase (NAD+, L-lysine-forming)
VYTSFANKHQFDEMHYLDIIDCNAGNHGKAFATNFNPEINIREITQPGRYWENGAWVEIPAMSIHKPIDYPGIGPKESYVLYHEELESLVKNFPTLKRARFWMTFGQAYLTHLEVLQNVGMTSIAPIKFQGMDIVPLEFLKAVLPPPESLGENYTGQTSIGCQIKGIKDGEDKTYYVWNNCDHAQCWKEVRAQAVSYTTGVPAMIGAMLMLTNAEWMKAGVWNCEELNPDPFMDLLNQHGLPWNEQINQPLPHEY